MPAGADQRNDGTIPDALCLAHDEDGRRARAIRESRAQRGSVQAFLDSFGPFLSEDSRHDFWIRAHDDNATIVWDRHDLIYAYGPLDAFESVLRDIGLRADTPPSIPDPHVHHYHAERDGDERAVLQAFDWIVKPLRESDVQFVESR